MQKVDYEALKSQLDKNEEADFDFQKRRHSQWTENYQLYRDKIIVNRLTQRQSINVPFIKGIVKTTLANIDEFPKIEFEELGNNKDQEIILNELWSDFVIKDRLEVKDIIDKKQNLIYGKTWHKFNIVNGRIVSEIKDPFDILVDRYGDPSDIETYDHISEHGIYRTIAQLEANPSYDKAAINRLKVFYGTKNGLIKAEQLTQIIAAKNERLESLGVSSMDNAILGQTWVELKAHYQKIWDKEDKEFHLHIIVKVDHEILSAKPMKEVLGVDFYPLVTWSDDPERLDHYPDGVADTARTTNKLLNANVSALTENRILRNFGMNFYDSSIEGFVPQTYEPTPFGWYAVPVPQDKKLSDVFQKVDIPDLSESIDEMEYVKRLVETAVASNSTVQGNTEQRKVTLGEVELAMGAAKERLTSIAKFYRLAATEKADKWAKLMNANGDKLESVKLYKKSHKGNFFTKTVSGKDWKSEAGYNCRAVSSAERESQSLETIQKLNAVKAQFPQNMAMTKIYGNKILEFGDLTPDEIKEVMDEEEQKFNQMGMQQGMPPEAQIGAPQPEIMPSLPTDPMQLNSPVNV